MQRPRRQLHAFRARELDYSAPRLDKVDLNSPEYGALLARARKAVGYQNPTLSPIIPSSGSNSEQRLHKIAATRGHMFRLSSEDDALIGRLQHSSSMELGKLEVDEVNVIENVEKMK